MRLALSDKEAPCPINTGSIVGSLASLEFGASIERVFNTGTQLLKQHRITQHTKEVHQVAVYVVVHLNIGRLFRQ